MSKINIFFNNKDYLIDESAFSSASNKLKSHLLNVMNGSGAVINFGGTSYNVDSTKLSKVRNDFVSHLGTISGNGSKVSVNGIEYNVDSSKIASVVSELETVFGSLESDSLLYKVVWSDTPTMNLHANTGEVTEDGNAYVSEPYSLENGYVYAIEQTAGSQWLTCVAYDSAGNYRYNTYIPSSETDTLYVDGYDDAVIRLSIERHSDEFDLSSIKPVKTDRIWSAQKYSCNTSTGKIAIKGQDCITLQKIPVEGGATYKLSTTGNHQWLKWLEYAEDGTYLGVKGDTEAPKEVEATVNRYATHVILAVYGGESNVDDYVTFVKMADAPEV